MNDARQTDEGAEELRGEVVALRAQLASVAQANARAALEMAAIHEARQKELIEQREALRTALAEAEEASRKKDEFLAKVSHELRTPLNGIIGMTTLLFDSVETEFQRDYAANALDSAKALLTIVEDILDLAKIEATGIELEDEPLDLWQLVDGVARLLAPQCDLDRVQFGVVACSEAPRFVLGDAARLRQVLMNLCSNALKFTEAGRITVRLDTVDEGETVRIRVEDTGTGIPENGLEAIFEAFRQFDNSAARSHGGTGLGLPISRSLVQRMGGTLTVTSRPGKGSTFEVRLPLRAPVTGAAPPHRPGTTFHAVIDEGPWAELVQQRAAALGAPLRVQPSIDAARAAGVLDELAPGHVVLVHAVAPRADVEEFTAAAEAKGAEVVLASCVDRADDWDRTGARRILWTPLWITEVNALFTGEAMDARRPEPAASGASVFRRAARPLRVLVVEDNRINQRVTARTLERIGHEAVVAESGARALEELGRSRFDVVLMDCQMPGMDGYETTRRIRWGGRVLDASVPIIALTANAMPGDRERCLAAGMNVHLAKPFQVDELRGALGRVTGTGDSDAA